MEGNIDLARGPAESKIPVYVLNLASSVKRLQRVIKNTKNMEKIQLFRIEAFLGRDLTDLMCQLLTSNQSSPQHKGTLGCFISHSLAWQAIAAQEAPFGLVMEDDAIIENYEVLAGLSLPPDVDFVFCNRRTTYLDDSAAGSLRAVGPILEHLVSTKQAVGGDGYLLTPQGAAKLLRFVKKDLMFSHVDLRMMAYCLPAGFSPPGEERSKIVQNILGFRGRYPKAHQLNAYSLFPYLTRHISMRQAREKPRMTKGWTSPACRKSCRRKSVEPATPATIQPGLAGSDHAPALAIISVKWKINHQSLRFSSPDDYEALTQTPISVEQARTSLHLPYCFDSASECVIYTIIEESKRDAVMAAPFLYIGQRAQSRQLLSVPLKLAAAIDDAAPISPTYIFSPGRTGSTLLSRFLSAAGSVSFSEPDIFTQIATLNPALRARLGGETIDMLIRAAMASIIKFGDDKSPFIKLRSHCTPSAKLLARAIAGSKIVFMFRGAADWARSRANHFNEKPAQLAAMLRTNIAILDQLCVEGLAPTVITYERLLSNTFSELRKLTPAIDADDMSLRSALEKIRSTDSQEGSSLKRGGVKRFPVSEDFLPAFYHEWQAVRPNELIIKHGLSEVFG